MTEIGNLVKAIAPYYTGDGVMQTFDKTQRFVGMRQLRQQLPRVYGRGWNARSYSAADMAKIAADSRFSPEVREAAKFLASPEGAERLARMNSRSGARGDRRFSVQDLEGANREVLQQRVSLAGNADQVAMDSLGDITRKLNDSFSRATGSVAQALMNAASTGIA